MGPAMQTPKRTSAKLTHNGPILQTGAASSRTFPETSPGDYSEYLAESRGWRWCKWIINTGQSTAGLQDVLMDPEKKLPPISLPLQRHPASVCLADGATYRTESSGVWRRWWRRWQMAPNTLARAKFPNHQLYCKWLTNHLNEEVLPAVTEHVWGLPALNSRSTIINMFTTVSYDR